MEEIVQIVNRINDSIYDSNGKLVDEYGCYCEISSNGFQTIVKFLDICIWDDDNDEREFVDEFGYEYEPLEPYLRKKIAKIIEEINKIKVA